MAPKHAAVQVMLASTMTKIFAVFAVGLPFCFLGGIAYSWTSGKSLLDGFVCAYGALYKVPGELWLELIFHACRTGLCE